MIYQGKYKYFNSKLQNVSFENSFLLKMVLSAKDYNPSKISKHIDSWKCGFISRFVNLTIKVKEEECKNQNYFHFGLFCNCFVSKVEVQNNVEAKSFSLACM